MCFSMYLPRTPRGASGDEGRLVINPIVYAEISTGFDTIEDLDEAVPADDFERETLPYEAGFLAGKAFLAYRRRGGQCEGASAGRRFQTSTSAPMRRCGDTGCSLATSRGTGQDS